MEMFLTDAARAGHLIGLATGFGLALAADLLALRSLVHPVSHRDVWLLGWLHRLILGGLALLWLSGLLLLQHRTGFDPALFTPKLICKLAVVSLLTLNALLIGVYVLPRYTANAGRRFGDFELVPRLNLSLVAGISMSCWASALVLGVSLRSGHVLADATAGILTPPRRPASIVSLLGIRSDQADFTSSTTGAVLGVYYLGYVAGSLTVTGLVRGVGHIRVFAAFTSMASAAVLVHGVWISPVPWMLLRFLTGLCIAGLFVISESWLNEVATPTTRATLLGIYNTVITLGLGLGTLLLNAADTAGIVLFVVGSVFVSMAAVPVALAPHEAPPPKEPTPVSWRSVWRTAPVGVAGAAASGLGSGTALGFGAVYAVRAGFGVSGASQFVVSVLVGAVVGQIPLGSWSDRTDRRFVIAVAAFMVVAGAVLGMVATDTGSFTLVLGAGALIGAGAFSLYGLSMAHLADYLEPSELIGAGARLILANGLAAASGPILASVLLTVSGPEGMFELLAATLGAFGMFTLSRIPRRKAADPDHRGHYLAVSSTVTPAALDDVVSEIDHRAP